eukprot:743346-Alexandrium_andersonii.AAC.1
MPQALAARVATGALAMTPTTVRMKPSLPEAFVQGSLWPPSGQRGSACTASAWRTCGGADYHVQ